MLDIEVSARANDRVVVAVRGALVGSQAAEGLRRAVEPHVVDDGVGDIRLDLSRVRPLDDTGRHVLAVLRHEAADRGKRLFIQAHEDFDIQGSFRATPVELRHVRAFLRDAAASGPLSPDELGDLILAASEACANVVMHAEVPWIEVGIRIGHRCVEVEVHDEGIFRPLPALDDPLAEEGRGLVLMAGLVQDVVIHRGTAAAPGTTVRLRRCRGQGSAQT